MTLRNFFARIGLATPDQFDMWSQAWRVAVAGGSQETLLAFMCRERGLSEEMFLQQLAKALNWPY
ncbi:MAG TPA: type II/IV secretion system protein, partial [Verrucomicrobiae bacterium]|nr:type II/IV secretion system protein [Verrucomicrobiae bacterium]